MNDQSLLKLAYAAFVADRTSQQPIEFARWQDLPEEEQRRYTEIAQAVVKEYQSQLQEEMFRLTKNRTIPREEDPQA